MNKTSLNKSVLVIVGIIILFLCIWLFRGNLKSTQIILDITPPQEIQTATTTATQLFQYIEIIDSCGPYYVGECVNMRSGAGTEFPVVERLRIGVVLKVKDTVTVNGRKWYKIQFDEDIKYPERITGDWYVASGNYIRLFGDEGDIQSNIRLHAASTKKIVVDISQEMLYAYDGDTLFMKEPISTGLEFTPTPYGTFSIFKKTPSRYMQGPIPGVSEQKYDLPGVPWDLYFTRDGAVIHGAYWHDHFGEPWSHGCVNLSPQNAKKLYLWADIGTLVTVKN